VPADYACALLSKRVLLVPCCLSLSLSRSISLSLSPAPALSLSRPTPLTHTHQRSRCPLLSYRPSLITPLSSPPPRAVSYLALAHGADRGIAWQVSHSAVLMLYCTNALLYSYSTVLILYCTHTVPEYRVAGRATRRQYTLCTNAPYTNVSCTIRSVLYYTHGRLLSQEGVSDSHEERRTWMPA
jgi:hypothetical protein